MDLDLTSDQELFVTTTRRFLEAAAPLSEIRALHGKGGGFEPEYWRRGAELGWTATLVPEALGGGSVSAAGLADAALVAEEMGRLVAPGPLLSVNVVLDALVRTGAHAAHPSVVGALLSGRATAAWAFDEGSASWDGSDMRTEAVSAGDRDGGWVMNGTKRFVLDAPSADWLLVTTHAGTGLAQFLVAATTPGVTVTSRNSIDMSRRVGDVVLRDVRLPASSAVGTVGGAAADIERQLQVALVLQNAETVGALDHVFEITLAYANDRVAFGRPIASYQALKHRFADNKMWLEACHATAAASAIAVAQQADNAGELVSVAKSYIADRAPHIAQDCVQIHGGIGVTWEHDLHLYLRRITQNAIMFGDVSHHRRRLAALAGL